ncbi:MAG TPA: DUF106 domain-containing protein [Archaeoglobus profundus]|nr:DUF106 domain-containing protein [Archaeoglobus profundus]HIP58723.1 DUF106 domain-containing protein [Archaeoglobus profundus]
MKDTIQKLLMVLGGIFFIGVLIPEFRIIMAKTVDPILRSLLIFPIHIVIMILATITAIYSSLIQKYMIDFRKMKEMQEKIFEFERQYFKAIKENNQFLIKQLEKRRDEIRLMQAEIMKMNFTSIFYVMIVTIPIWIWLWYVIYDVAELGIHNKVSKFTIIVPFQGYIHVSDFIVIIPWWLFWYLLCSMLVGQVIRKIIIRLES